MVLMGMLMKVDICHTQDTNHKILRLGHIHKIVKIGEPSMLYMR